MRIFAAILFFSAIGPMIRFYKSSYFYFFFLASIVDPLILLASKFSSPPNNQIQFYIIGNLLLALSLPNLSKKFKVGLILFILFYFIIERSEITSLMAAIFIMLFILINFVYTCVQTIRREGKLILFLVPMILLYSSGIFWAYYYSADIFFVTQTINFKLMIYTLFNVLITIAGPNGKINFKYGYDPTIKAKIVNELQIHVDEYDQLLEKGFSHREIQIYQLLRQGRTNKEIADQFNIEKRTVESHLKNIKTKLGFESMAELRDFIKKSEQIEPTI